LCRNEAALALPFSLSRSFPIHITTITHTGTQMSWERKVIQSWNTLETQPNNLLRLKSMHYEGIEVVESPFLLSKPVSFSGTTTRTFPNKLSTVRKRWHQISKCLQPQSPQGFFSLNNDNDMHVNNTSYFLTYLLIQHPVCSS
jgi:hypothetical protein